jgi:hypothetical protein
VGTLVGVFVLVVAVAVSTTAAAVVAATAGVLLGVSVLVDKAAGVRVRVGRSVGATVLVGTGVVVGVLALVAVGSGDGERVGRGVDGDARRRSNRDCWTTWPNRTALANARPSDVAVGGIVAIVGWRGVGDSDG